jgi:TATA-binding protein-associated factor
MLDGTNPLPCRLGAVEVMAVLMQQLQRQLVPYTVLLVVPLLRRMSDPAAAVRRRAALCFGGLMALLPLAQGMPLPEGLDEVQRKAAEQDAEFLSQLLDNKRVEDYSLPVRLKVRMGLVFVVCVLCLKEGDDGAMEWSHAVGVCSRG